jgi:uncharacterized coiled-coil protein SlyX
MHDETPLSQEVWEHIPAEAQAYIRALEARIGLLEETVQGLKAALPQVEATVHQWREQLQQKSRTSSRPPSSDPPRRWANVPTVSPVAGGPAGNSVIRDRRASQSRPCCHPQVTLRNSCALPLNSLQWVNAYPISWA